MGGFWLKGGQKKIQADLLSISITVFHIFLKDLRNMSNKEQRLEIIKDALLHLPQTKPKQMSYVSGNVTGLTNLKDDIDNVRENCEVCMLGGLFLSSVGLYNNVEIDEVFDENGICFEINNLNLCCTLENNLGQYFDEYQLNLIEVAFERRDVNNYFYDLCDQIYKTEESVDYCGCNVCKDYNAATDFGFSGEPLIERMRRILENMLENDGIFVP